MAHCYNNNNSTFTIHNEKYEISSDHQDINQEEAPLHYNLPDHRNTIQQQSVANDIANSYSDYIGNDTIQRLNRIQQYNKAFEHCLNQQSGLGSWKNRKPKQLPLPLPPPSLSRSPPTVPRNSTDSLNPLKRLLLLNENTGSNNGKLSSFIIKKTHIADVKKKLHRTSQPFIFATNLKHRPKRYSDVLTDKVLVA
ncbi:hypothetical protein K501DRAFT_337473 [Backusella circina FSU 941]|nr:hypothetical protein K501DRAFT_337473 [Backusella circina FSU 941]